MPAPDRDLLDWLTVAFTISTGFVIAAAALVAYALQRARYLRDIAPDIRFGRTFRIYPIIQPTGFQISFAISNRSDRNVAEKVKITAMVSQPGGPPDSSIVVAAEIAPGTEEWVAFHFGGSTVPTISTTSPGRVSTPRALKLTVDYRSPWEFLLFLVNFFSGRARYHREASGAWDWVANPDETYKPVENRVDSSYLIP